VCPAGARLDVGRLANLAGNFIDNRLEEHIPLLFWKIPLTRRLYEKLIPAPDREQMRYNLKGWAAEFAHDFDNSTAGPVVGLSKRLGSSGAMVAATCDTGEAVLGCYQTEAAQADDGQGCVGMTVLSQCFDCTDCFVLIVQLVLLRSCTAARLKQ
jgi:hypothetical protein